jgi:hypothetical protein
MCLLFLILAIVVQLGRAQILADASSPVVTGSGESVLDRYSAGQKKNLLAGEPVFESGIGEGPGGMHEAHGRTIALVNKPIDECFKIFCEFDKQYLYFPRITVSRVLKREGNTVVIYKEVGYAIATIRYTHILTIDPEAYRVDFVTDPKGINNVRFSSGYFRFEKVDESRSLFTYELTKMDSGFTIPEFIKKYIASKDLPKIAINIKKRIESGGTWEK